MYPNITVLGAGSWGTALALLLTVRTFAFNVNAMLTRISVEIKSFFIVFNFKGKWDINIF